MTSNPVKQILQDKEIGSEVTNMIAKALDHIHLMALTHQIGRKLRVSSGSSIHKA